jgi:S1-C subfamily serine protease
VTLRQIPILVSVAATTLALVVAPAAGGATTALSTGVVEIQTRYGSSGGAGAGTGMVVTASGEVLTNNHVIRGATQIRVRVPESRRTYRARVLGYSISADVALLRLTGATGLETVSLGNSSTVSVGDEVVAVGNAGGTGRLSTKSGTVTARGVTIEVGDGRSGTVRLSRLIETSADLRQGDSGGPLLDASERVIGMNAAATTGDGLDSDGYAIPIDRVRSIAARIRAGDSTATVHVGPTPFLGVLVATQPSGSSRGLLLAGVQPGSPAARAGIERGDVLLSLNGTVIRSSSQLVALLLRFRPGDAVRLAWTDELGERQTAPLILASGPPQ